MKKKFKKPKPRKPDAPQSWKELSEILGVSTVSLHRSRKRYPDHPPVTDIEGWKLLLSTGNAKSINDEAMPPEFRVQQAKLKTRQMELEVAAKERAELKAKGLTMETAEVLQGLKQVMDELFMELEQMFVLEFPPQTDDKTTQERAAMAREYIETLKKKLRDRFGGITPEKMLL